MLSRIKLEEKQKALKKKLKPVTLEKLFNSGRGAKLRENRTIPSEKLVSNLTRIFGTELLKKATKLSQTHDHK